MDQDHVRARLDEERERLQGIRTDLDEIKTDSHDDALQELSSNNQHQADVGSETFDRERDLTILDQVEGELADVERALQRLDEGTYGTCEACGRPIDEERLEVMPATRFCIADQAAAEREQRDAIPAESTSESGA